MRVSGYGRYALTSYLAVAMLVGCGASQQLPVGSADTTSARLQERPALTVSTKAAPTLDSKSGGYKVTPPLLYVTNVSETDDDVKIYNPDDKDAAPLATISDKINTPNGDCIDSKGTLYVTNEPSDGPGWISEYPLGKTVASKVITEGVSTPAFCAIDADGNLWVTNLGSNDVAEYLYGSAKPHVVITKGLYYPLGIAIDHAANLYVVNGFGSSNRSVKVYASGSKSPSRTITNGVTWPDGIALDSNGTLYVPNIVTENVEEYRYGQSIPFQTITDDMHQPANVTVSKKGVLYVANLESQNSSVVEFRVGSLQPKKRQITDGLFNPQGLAYYPPIVP
jgi:serine/threonine-protein kinase